jgi:hypothetical protein
MSPLNHSKPGKLSKILGSLLVTLSLILGFADYKQTVVNFTEPKFKPTCI